MMPKETSRQHVLAFLDSVDSAGRKLADEYREQNGLKVKDRCVRCNTKGHYYTCPESDRVAFACSNFTKKDMQQHERAVAKQNSERLRTPS